MRIFTVTVPTGAALYHAGDIVGGKITLTNILRALGGRGKVVGLTLLDGAKQSAVLEIYFFKADLTVQADNAAEAISAADMAKCLGAIYVAAGDYKLTANAGVARPTVTPFTLQADGSRTLYMAVKCTGGPTFTASCITLLIQIDQDEL